jgi:hypothetical protein
MLVSNDNMTGGYPYITGNSNNQYDSKGYPKDGLGGGVFVNGDSLTMTGSRIQNNYTNEWGGGVLCYGGNLNITKGVITGNEGYHGGGVYVPTNLVTNVTLEYSFIMGNKANTLGGGIVFGGQGATSITASAFIGGNTAQGIYGLGGGLYVAQGNVTLSNYSSIIDNTASTSGGGVYVQSGGTFTHNNGGYETGNTSDNVFNGQGAMINEEE